MSTFSYEKTYLPSLCSNIVLQQKNRETLHCAGKDIYARAEFFFRQNVVVRVGLTRTTKFQAWLVAGLDSSFWSCTLALMIQCIWEPSKTELSFDGNFMFIQQQTW